MVRGRRPKPAAIKLHEGNRGKRAVTPAVAIAPGAPDPPTWLSKEARAEWQRIVPELEAFELVARVDRAALAIYCQAWGTYHEAERALMKAGRVLKDPDGAQRRSPWVLVARDAAAMILRIAGEFGFTAVARQRLGNLAAGGRQADDFDTFVRSRSG